MNVDLAASGVAFKERMNVPVIAGEIKVHQLLKVERILPRAPAALQERRVAA